MSTPRVLSARAATVKVGKEVVSLNQGDELPKNLSKEQVEQLDALGALRPINSPTPSTTAGAPPHQNGPVDVRALGAAQLADVIKQRELSSGDTVALAESDAGLAAKVLEAENAATGGSPREDVETALKAILDDAKD